MAEYSSHNPSPEAPIIAGIIRQEDLAELDASSDEEYDSRRRQLIEKAAGATLHAARGNVVGIVPMYDEEGNVTDAHYYTLGEQDPGVRLRPETAQELGLPDPREHIDILPNQQRNTEVSMPVPDHLNAAFESLSRMTGVIGQEVSRERMVEDSLNELVQTWNQLTYSGTYTDQILGTMSEKLAALASEYDQSVRVAPELRNQATGLAEAVETARSTLTESGNGGYDTISANDLRRADESAQELVGQLRIATRGVEDRQDGLVQLRGQIESMIHDSYGRDAYAALVRHMLTELTEGALPRSAYMRAQNELEVLSKIMPSS